MAEKVWNFFSEEHEIFRQQVRSFCEEQLAPHADEWEEEGNFPRWVFEKMGELGFLGITYPEKYGGTAADFWTKVVFAEELPRCQSSGVLLSVLVQTDMCTPAIVTFGTDEQKEEILRPAIQGKKIGAICVTEPNAGSDVAAIRSTAKKDGDYYIINGSKTFITNGSKADWLTLAVKTNPDKGYSGISLFLFPTTTPGFTVTRKLNKLGHRGTDTVELAFEDCKIHKKYLLGEEGKGFYAIMHGFQYERLVGCIAGIAGIKLLLQETVNYCKERTAFGKKICEHQANAHKLADLATEIEAAQSLIYHCSDMVNRGLNAIKEVSMCKLLVGELGVSAARQCLQLHGGYGYIEEYRVCRAYRDVMLGTIGGGSSEIMREIIARMMGLYG